MTERQNKCQQIMFIVKEGCIGSLGPDDLVFQNAQCL